MQSSWMIRFLKKEEGAVTVDWVILTAALVGLCIAAVGITRTTTYGLATTISAKIQIERETLE